ncbi:MAG: IgGFc-binding protein, partial [Candidatus Kapaibacterium sp.]
MKHSNFFALFLALFSLFILPDSTTRAQSNVGTEFYLAFPTNWEAGTGESYIRLYITSEVETKVDIYALGQFKQSVKTKPNDIVTFDLTPLEGQIFVRDEKSPVPNDRVYQDKAVRVVAESPIILYAMNRRPFTTDGLLALPVSALGKEYVVPSAASVGTAGQELPSQYMIAAPYDNTTVTIINPMSTPNHKEGQTFTITLHKGDVFSAMSVGNNGDLTGAHIVASRPIAVTAGHHCTYIPDFQYPACDHLTEMLTPVTSWGRVYNALPLANRTKGDTYRILAGEPDADVLINGVKVATLSRVGGPQGVGWIEYREDTRRPLTFSSNKLIQVVQYSNGQQYDNASGSDPFYTILTPVEQYQSNLSFSTLAIDFPLNYFAFVGDSLGIATAEIAKAGTGDWKKLSTQPTTVSYTFPTSPTETHYAGLIISSIGTFRVRSEGKLAGTMYAGSQFDSYGFPIALLVENRAIVDTVPPTVEWSVECGNLITATVRDMPDDPAPRSNLSTIWLDYSASSNCRLFVDPFISNESRTATFRLEAINPREDGRAVVQIRDWSGNVVFDTIDYGSPDLAIASQDFGMVPLNEQRGSLVKVE